MTKAQLVQEVIDRGYDYLKPTRIGDFVQRSYRTICTRRNWPFLETGVTGTAPLEISDVRKVLSVKDTTNEFQPRGVDRRWLIYSYPNLTDTGAPQFWYLEDDTLKTYPVEDTAQLEVRYVKRPATLADNDEPLIPEEWQYLIVDLAVTYCLKDDDEGQEARALRAEVSEGIVEMAHDLLGRNLQNPGFIVRTGRAADYLA